MLCFYKDNDSTCHSFDGATTKPETSSIFPHKTVRALGNYKNSPFVTGHSSSSSGYGLKTEILNYSTSTWVHADDYPFSNTNEIAFYATASTDESVFIIGGHTEGWSKGWGRSSIIAEYKDGSWKNVGNLAQARNTHSAINFGSAIMVVGGYPLNGDRINTELWDMESSGSQIIGESYPKEYKALGLFEVDVGFCSKN